MIAQNDFIVDWRGNCFFCWKKIPTQLPPVKLDPDSTNKSFPIYSLQCLSRYLQIDLSKVFPNKGLVSPHLLAQVKKSKLKVELCPECASINERLSEQYRQLEKIERDVISGVQVIIGKLEGEGTGETHETEDAEIESEFSMGKFKVVKALRKETMKRGLEKLNNYVPKVLIRNLTADEANDKRSNIRQNFRIPPVLLPESSEYLPQGEEMSIGNVKLESRFEDFEQIDDDEEKSYSDHFDESSHSAITDDDEDDDTTGLGIPIKSEAQTSKDTYILTPNFETSKHGLLSLRTKYVVSAGAGIHTCRDCSSEFPNYRGFYLHYRAVHLKIMYKCSVCGHTCFDLGNLNRHQKNAHKGVTYKCQVCSQVFSRQSNLLKHQRPDGCAPKETEESSTVAMVRPPKQGSKVKIGDMCSRNKKTGKFKCRLCAAELATMQSFRNHYEGLHQDFRYKCTLCPKDFAHRANYNRHYNVVHLKCSFKCHVCNKDFSSQQNCDRHHKSVHAGVKFKCKECGKSFAWEVNFHRHLRSTSCGESREQDN